MTKSTVTSKGQVIIQTPISHLKGIVKSKRKKPVSLAEMKKAISDGAQKAMK